MTADTLDTTGLPRLPFDRPGTLDVGPVYARLRAEHPVTRVMTPAGDQAWLVTGYAEAKQLFGDDRLDRCHPHPERAPLISAAGFNGGPTGNPATRKADHARMRRLLVPAFSARRMRALDADVRALTDTLLDEMVAAGGDGRTVDLHEHLAVPLPIYVICQLLGVPYADRAHFKTLSERAAVMTGDDAMAAIGELFVYTAGLAEAKRSDPGEDVISDLVAAQREDPTFNDTELAMLVAGVLFAGHETTVGRIGFGTLLLLENPAARAALVADPTTVGAVVEEVLRLAAPEAFGVARWAHGDIEVGDVTIAEGEAVVLSMLAMNRDGAAFPDPDAFDITRTPNAHMTFGHGAHYCIGASLARTELKIVLSSLFTRLPGLRLAVEPGELRLHTERLTGGLYELPVTW